MSGIPLMSVYTGISDHSRTCSQIQSTGLVGYNGHRLYTSNVSLTHDDRKLPNLCAIL